MLILLAEVVYWACVPWGGHSRVEYVRASVALGDALLRYLLGACCKGGKDIISDGFNWVRTEFFRCGGVG